MSITGHQTSKEITRYTKAASQKTRAASALVKMTAERNGNRSVPLFAAMFGGGTKPKVKPKKYNDIFGRWQPVGESNPSSQVENLVS